MIVTAKSSIPTLWQWIVACTWGALRFKFMVMGAVFVFSLQKFIENPAAVTFILSLPTILSLVIGPVCRFLSDRIWTRFGRRKPFAVPSMVGIGLSFLLMPAAPNFWWLVAAYCLYHIANDFGAGPTEILKQEIIPPPQRGRASALASWIGNLASLAFYGLALGRFEDVGFFAGFPVSGEQAIYWGIAAMVFCVALFVMLGVKESPQDSPLRGQRLTFKTFVGGLSDRNLWPVYLLIVGWTVSGAGLGALTALLYSEQWGFTKQEMGINIAVGGVLNILFIALLGIFADRLPRMRTFKILLALSIAIEVAFFCYCEFVLHDKTPTLPEIILFGEITAVIGILLGMVYFPMVYDYIPRNEMGTFSAGSSIVERIIGVVTLNGVGLFVSFYSHLFLPPAGDMVRIGFPHTVSEAEARQWLAQSPLNGVSVVAWHSNGAAIDHGQALEFRRENAESTAANTRLATIEARLKALREKASGAEEIHRLEMERKTLQDKLKSSSREFATLLEPVYLHAVAESHQIEAVRSGNATVFEIPLAKRPSNADVEAALRSLRSVEPDVVDLRLGSSEKGFHLSCGLTGGNPAAPSTVFSRLTNIAPPSLKRLLPASLPAGSAKPSAFLEIDVATAGDPVNRHPSPVTRILNRIWGLFGEPPAADRRLGAVAREMRQAETWPHVRGTDISTPGRHALRITALPERNAIPPDDTDPIILARCAEFPGIEPALAAALYQRLESVAPNHRITPVQRTLASDYAPLRYDYLSGYLWMVFMSSIGLAICLAFTRREEKGLIRKRGLEENKRQMEAEADESERERQGAPDAHEYYVPGYILWKITFLIVSLAILGAGLWMLVPKLAIAASGSLVQARVEAVTYQDGHGQMKVFKSATAVREFLAEGKKDGIFQLRCVAEMPDGSLVRFTPSNAQTRKPLVDIVDEDGLPSTLMAYVPAGAPTSAILPFEIGTWFMPGLVAFLGATATVLASLLVRSARRPIALPLLQPRSQSPDLPS
jgi:Na+/melibiose symporter-like transporter